MSTKDIYLYFDDLGRPVERAVLMDLSLPARHLEDFNLSLAEKGLLSMLLMEPPDAASSMTCSTLKTIRKTMQDLEAHGYINCRRCGRQYVYEIYPVAIADRAPGRSDLRRRRRTEG